MHLRIRSDVSRERLPRKITQTQIVKERQQRIYQAAIARLKIERDGRMSAIVLGRESPALAALILQKFGRGLETALTLIEDADGISTMPKITNVVDALVRSVDPDIDTHQHERWNARPADLDLSMAG